MDCITKIEGISKEDGNRKYGTLQPRRKKKATGEGRSRSLSGGAEQCSVTMEQSRKRTNTKQPGFKGSSCSDTGSFLDLLFSSDEEDVMRPCRQFSRSSSDRDSQRRKQPMDWEKRKLNRGFPSGEKQARTARTRMRSTESDSSDTMMISAPTRPSRRFLTIKRSCSKGSTGSTTSSCSNPISPAPKMEFERPNLFDQLRCEQQGDMESGRRKPVSNGRVAKFGRQVSAPLKSTNHVTVPQLKASRSKDSLSRNMVTTQPLRDPQFEHSILKNRRSPDGHLRTPSSDGGYHSSKNIDRNGHSSSHSNGHTKPRASSSRRGTVNPRKVSPTFDILFDDVPDTSPTKPIQKSGRKPTPMVQSGKGNDPLIMALTGKSRRVARSPTGDLPVVIEPARSQRPMTEAQRRYEMRFNRSVSRSSEAAVEAESLRELSPTPPYPDEILNSYRDDMPTTTSGYSLDMITPTPSSSHSDTWTAPRLDDGPGSLSETTTVKISGSIEQDLDQEIENQLLGLDNEVRDKRGDEGRIGRVGTTSLSSLNGEYSITKSLLAQDVGA